MSNAALKCSTGEVLDDADHIAQVIRQVDDLVNTIAVAIEEQSAVTRNMAREATDVVCSRLGARERVIRKAACFREIAKEIAKGHDSPGEMSRAGLQAGMTRSKLPELAEQLVEMVERLRIGDDGSIRDGTADTSSAARSDISFIVPSDRLSPGVPGMDNHHKRFLVLINELHDSVKRSDGRDTQKRILDELVRCTQCHFWAEEALIRKHAIPDPRLRKRARRRFVNKIGEFQRRFDEGDPSAVLEAMNAIRDWLIDHIRKTQSRHRPYVH